MKCPQCHHEILNENINIKADVAQCQDCGFVFKISESLKNSDLDFFNIAQCPHGAWYKKEDGEIIIGATTRSFDACFIVPFGIVWISFFIFIVFGSQISSGTFSLIPALIAIPFFFASICIFIIMIMTVFGEVEIVMNNVGGEIYTGISGVGLKRKFSWSDVTNIKDNEGLYIRYPGASNGTISLEGIKKITFASNVREARRYYLYKALKQIHYNYQVSKSIS